MPQIAIIADMHANLPALQSVWADLEGRRADAVYHLGDLIGYNPYPAEVIAFVRDHDIPGLCGNYDLAVSDHLPDPVAVYLKPSISPVGRAAYEWTRDRVPPAARDYLRRLPRSLALDIEGRRVVLVHGSPQNVREYVYPDTPDERLAELLSLGKADILICGHTHRPMIRRVGGGLVLNPGSVGKPKDGDPRASYLMLHVSDGRVEPEIRRVEYPVQDVVAAIRATDLPEAMAVSLEKGTSA